LGPEFELQHNHAHALQHGFHTCHHCQLLVPDDLAACPRCHNHLHSRKPNSIKRTIALLLSAAILFIPANVYPVMTVMRFGSGEPSTILGGVVQLIDAGMLPLALLVLFASIVVPAMKLAIFTFLLISIRRRSSWRPLDRTRLYRLVEVVGAWSMVDVYLVAILAAVVQLDFLATIQPAIGATFFAAVVVLTMFAAHSFDPRLIWDNNGRN
jgi:paraquat-inducible protein A